MNSARCFTRLAQGAVLLAVVFPPLACTRKASDSANVSIQLSRSIPAHGKVDAQDASAVLTHIAVNVSGSGINPTKFVEADGQYVAGTVIPLNPKIELEVPSGSGRLIQVLAVYENLTTHVTTIKYGDVSKDLTGGNNDISITVADIVAGFKSARVAGRFLTGNSPFDRGPTGKMSISFPVGNSRPDMIIQRGEIVNGWFSWFGANVGLKYTMDSGEVLFNSLNVAALSGSSFAPGADSFLRVEAPTEIYRLDGGVWLPDEPKDLVAGFFAAEGNSSLLAGHIACRGYGGTPLEVASDGTGTSLNYDPAGAGTGYRGFNGHSSSTSECNYGGPIGYDRFISKTMHFSIENLQRGAGDTAGGQKGIFSLISHQADVGYLAGPYSAVATGDNHTCAISSANGDLTCWGANGQGQLGDGTYTSSTSPVMIGTSYQAVDAGQSHTCAVTASGELKCWGANSQGQLGDNTNTASASPVSIAFSYAKVSAGANHTCGITTSNKLFCWGSNFQGRLGDGTSTDRLTPTAIDAAVDYSYVATGDYNGCAITTTGVLKCWGPNSSGQVGDGTTTDRLSPVVIDSGVTYQKVYFGYVHACAITTAGVMKCWGNGTGGRLGTGSLANKLVPTAVNSAASYIAGGVNQSTSCGVTNTGRLHCWGAGGIARFDRGVDEISSPADMMGSLFPINTFNMQGQTGCGLQTGGAIVCIGANSSNQLGLPIASAPQLSTYRRITAGGVAAAMFRTLPGVMSGDLFDGSHFDGVKVYKKDAARDDSIETVDCSETALAQAGYLPQSYTASIEPLTRTILVGFGAAWPTGNPGFVLCPTKAGQPVLGGVWFN